MSSEPRRQPPPERHPRPRRTGDPGPPRPDPARYSAGGGAEAADEDAVTLTDAKGMRALAHPVRIALLDLLGFHETLTATQASDLLGESPANCAFHLRTLAKYGFVREAGGGKGRERPWALTARHVTISAAGQADPQAALAADELTRFWLERWMDRARRVYGSRNQVPGWDVASGWSNVHLFLTPDEAISLRSEMRRMLSRYQDRLSDPALRPEAALPVEWTIFASPVPGLSDGAPVTGSEDRGATDGLGGAHAAND